MSQTIEVVLTITITDDAVPLHAAQALFDHLDDYDDDRIISVDDWKVIA